MKKYFDTDEGEIKTPLIQCKNLKLGYEGVAIINDLNFDVNMGDYLIILGENGSGKTTLLNVILGLKKQMDGEIIFSDELKQNEIGYLPQQTPAQKDFPATAYEIVLSGFQSKLGMRPFYNVDEKKAAMENMELLGIGHLKNKCYRDMSGGQQQRVLLSRALCATKKLILLDEPVAGLDPNAMENMYEIIDTINKEKGITIVMISHDIESARRYGSHILHIGNKIFYGSLHEYFKSGFEYVSGTKKHEVMGAKWTRPSDEKKEDHKEIYINESIDNNVDEYMDKSKTGENEFVDNKTGLNDDKGGEDNE